MHCFDILLRLFQDSIKNRKNQNFINTNCHLENTLEIWPVCDRLECCARRSCAPISKSPEAATHCWCKPASISQQHCAPLEKKAFSSWLPVVDSHKYQERQILLGSFWNQTLSLQLSAKKKKKCVIYFPLNERQTLCDFLLPEFGLHLTSNSQVQQLIPQEQTQLQVWKRLILTRSPVLENQRREDEWQISQSDRTWCFHQRISAETLTTVLSKQWE